MGISSACDRVTANAIDNILSRPRKTSQDALDWTCKPDYGRVPQYLQDVKKTLDLEYAYLESLRNSTKTAGAGPPGTTQVRVMPDHEKCALLAALKRRWDALNLEYQSTTHIMNLDTIGKARRKENFEEQLAAIEKFIIKASKKTVVVTNV
ncbi:putative enkurin [Besnoitia besnoiti]|uniref:Putative enkurin n=1 Tax=Besnoitia besnoiti TaxID=94643 RepID=A0A2A9M7X8_BESBE|nr:putative enkurin [Besnoitia besnoiti]PFH31757.1 putative enkurin [Besnoitia besnoiti]